MAGKRRGERPSVGAAELAVILQTSARRIYRLAAAGVLPHFRASGALRFDPELIQEWTRRNSLSSVQVSNDESDDMEDGTW